MPFKPPSEMVEPTRYKVVSGSAEYGPFHNRDNAEKCVIALAGCQMGYGTNAVIYPLKKKDEQ